MAVSRFPPKQIKIPPVVAGTVGVLGLVAAIGLVIVFTGVTTVPPGEVALIMNYVTGSAEAKLTNGTIVHLPFGLTRVYKLKKTVQSIYMTSDPTRGDRKGDDSVQVKTNDGSNVNIDVELQYQIIPESPEAVKNVVRLIGRGDKFIQMDLVRAYARSIMRDELGELSVTSIADPVNRDEKLKRSWDRINEALRDFGLKVTMLTATNPVFNADYEKMIKERKEADQDVRNQNSAQETARQEQKQAVAMAERKRSVAILQAEGEKEAKIAASRQQAEQILRRAEGEAYRTRKEGDKAFVTAENDAAAIEAEGLAKAKGIEELAKAFAEGGVALVREALAEKFRGVRLNGRPYSLDVEVNRLRIERDEADTAAAARASGRPTKSKE